MGSMIVITRNGKTTVLTGWRAWLAGAVAFVAMWVILALLAFILVGVGITIGTIMLLVIPAAIGVGLIGSFFRGKG